MLTPIQRFFRMLKPNRKAIRNLYIFAIINGIISLSLPLGIQAIINLIQGGEISASWVLLVVIVLLGYLISGGLQIVQLRISEDLQKDIFVRSAFEFVYRIPRIKMEVLEKHYAPELMNRFFDTITIQKGVAKILIDFTAAALSILFGLILLSFYHPFFILFSILVILIVFVLGRYIFNRGLTSSILESKYKYKVAFWLEEVARTNNTFKLFSGSDLPIKKTDTLLSSYMDAREDHFKVLLRQYYLFLVFKILIAAGFLILGGILVFNQQMNIGQFVASEIIVLLLIGSVEKVLLFMENIYDLLTSIEKIGDVTDMQLEENIPSALKIKNKKLGISIGIRKLDFKYPGDNEYIFQNLNLEIKPGEKVCITGANGSGASTLTKLLMSFFQPQKGTILYDNIPINNYNIDELRKTIASCVTYDRVFLGTLLENLTIGIEMPTENILQVLKQIGLNDLVENLPNGFATMIGPQGKKLPESTVEKIILARNLLKNPRLLVVDDMFNNMDKSEKIQLFKTIMDKHQGRTVITLTKDADIISMADRVIEIESGCASNTLNKI
jgi:ABC-type bacteriocin/lantibiotic exporter with double-glycine peptidase domain